MRQRLAALPAAAEAPVGVTERNRLPDGEHEAVAELRLQQRGTMAIRHTDLGRVHDIRSPQSGLEPQVAVAERERANIARSTARKPVAQGADRLDRQVERVEVERVRAGREHANVVPVGKQLPRTQLPRVRGVAAQDDDAWPPHRRRNA